MMSNKFDRKILHNNFEILRKQHHLKKGQFCKLIGIANAYRHDYSSVGLKLLKGIQDNFSGIDEKWLLTPHDLQEELLKSHYSEPVQSHTPINDIDTEYEKNPVLIKKVKHIIKSNTIYSDVLRDIILAYYAAVTCQEDLAAANKRIDKPEEQAQEIKDRLPAAGE